GVEGADGESVIRRAVQQALGVVPQLPGFLAGALGKHAGNRVAPTPPNLFQVGELGYVNGHRLLLFRSNWQCYSGLLRNCQSLIRLIEVASQNETPTRGNELFIFAP